MFREMHHGRASVADRVARNEAPVLLITGDSGIGKSTVLQMASAPRDGWLVTEPLALLHSHGTLYAAFLDQLGVVLGQLVADTNRVADAVERFAETARRLGDERVGVLARVAFAELIAILRGRVGDDVGKAAAAYAADISPDTVETLAAKVARSREPLVAEILCAFATTASEIDRSMHLALHFDDGQRLSDEDWRVLADLAGRLPPSVHVRIAYATDTAARMRAVVAFRADAPQVDELAIPELTEADVEQWLGAEDLSRALARELAHQTSGYPLLIESAIVHLKAGGELVNLPRSEQLAARTRAAWDELSPMAAAVARTLAVLPGPLQEKELQELSGITDTGTWATVVEELRNARLFSVLVDGQPWFHEERRAFVLRECLTPAHRDQAAGTAASLIWARGFDATDFAMAALFAEVIELTPSYHSQEPHLATASHLNDSKLAVAAALLELAIEGRLVSEADTLLSHALKFVDTIQDDPSALLAEMESDGLIVTASNDWSTAVAASWGPRAQAVIQGRSVRLLRRPAVLRLAEAVFQLALREQLGEFSQARFGLGNPSIATLGRMATGAEASSGYINRRELGDNVLLRGLTADGTPFYCSAAYHETAKRDEALARISELAAKTAIGEVYVGSTTAHPLAPVPVQRFAAALGRACRARADARDTGDIKMAPPVDASDDELVELRVRTAKLLCERASPVERLAMDIDRGFVLAWDADEDYWDECVIAGAGYGHQRLPRRTPLSVRDQYEGLRLRRELGLASGEEIVHRSTRGGRNVRTHPVAHEIGYRRERARIFNSAQPRLEVVLQQDKLQPLIAEAFTVELGDARWLRREFDLGFEEDDLEPRALWLLIVLDEPTEGWSPGARGMALYSEGPSSEPEDSVFVEFVQGRDEESGFLYTVEHDVFTDVFPDARTDSWGSSTIDHIVATLLRHHPDDIELSWSESTGPALAPSPTAP